MTDDTCDKCGSADVKWGDGPWETDWTCRACGYHFDSWEHDAEYDPLGNFREIQRMADERTTPPPHALSPRPR